jgi:NADH dehydrogenase [ubiquinone] 1 alpha subcomplex assembly factor 7
MHPVAEAIAEVIGLEGPIRFDRFMEMALYAPGGYYDRPPVGPGPDADFVTSPHVHPVFAQLLAEAIRGLHTAIGGPRPFELIEVGAGEGTLLRGLLPELADLSLRVTAVERSPGARASLSTVETIEVRDALPPPSLPAVLLAHELLDNLPFRRFRATAEGVREIHVGHDANRFVEVLATPTEAPGHLGGSPPADGEIVLPSGAMRLLADAFPDPTDGPPRALLAIDYGGERGAGGPSHGYAAHRLVEDVLEAPGTTDITAGVGFGVLADAARERGLQAFATVSQRDALAVLGFEAWMRAQLERQQDLLRTGRGAAAVATWGGRSRASLLVDPAGLGRFRWFVVTSPGVPEPQWMRSARALGEQRLGAGSRAEP